MISVITRVSQNPVQQVADSWRRGTQLIAAITAHTRAVMGHVASVNQFRQITRTSPVRAVVQAITPAANAVHPLQQAMVRLAVGK